MKKITITGAGSEMQGVGRISDGRAAFVPGALPGEEVTIEITRDAGRFCEARLVEILQASPDRRSPDCACYGVCGGCSAQHMTYARSLELKQARVRDAISRIGGVNDPAILPIIACEKPARTRNKAEYAIDARGGHVQIGSFANKSRRIIDLDDCLLQKEASIRMLRWTKQNLGKMACASRIRFLVTRVNRKGEMTAVFCGDAPVQAEFSGIAGKIFRDVPELISLYFCRLRNRPSHVLDGECTHISGARTMQDELLGLKFELSPQSFFQINPEQTEKLYTKALEAAGLDDGNMRVLDAYCGAGTITLAAARKAACALGVEIVAPAIENAKRNALANGLQKKTRFICADAAREIPRLMASGERFDVAILDPPRKGADQALLNAIAGAKIPRISYVSCNPATLARDIKIFCGLGYKFEWAQPVDMFPWTEHVETVALLSRV